MGVPCGQLCKRKSVFELLQAMERVPLRTGWPHMSYLYRQLCGKLWIPQICLNAEYRVPPTTRLYYADFRRNEVGASTRALRCIMKLRKKIWGTAESSIESFQGVVKLGFSWGGMDVLPFKGVASLVRNVQKLFVNKSCDCCNWLGMGRTSFIS